MTATILKRCPSNWFTKSTRFLTDFSIIKSETYDKTWCIIDHCSRHPFSKQSSFSFTKESIHSWGISSVSSCTFVNLLKNHVFLKQSITIYDKWKVKKEECLQHQTFFECLFLIFQDVFLWLCHLLSEKLEKNNTSNNFMSLLLYRQISNSSEKWLHPVPQVWIFESSN